jgi:signal transduction histidine kinase
LQLNKLNQEVNGLINTIVHDLKSPLNSMQGLLYLLEAEVTENEKAKLYISQGNKVLAGGHEIIQQLLELRELEEKPAALFIESIKLKEFVELLQIENGAYAQQKNIEIIAESDDTNIEIDKTLTKRLLNNLISNAIKFSHSGKQVRISAKVSHPNITFEVTDQGQGFTIGDKSKLFQKFQKLSAQPTGGESSNGLGLAIVQLLANRLRATVELKSEWGKGATFIVSIPLA